MPVSNTRALGTLLVLCACAATARAHTPDFPSRADDHAPIGVMGDHTHAAGEVMLSYRYGAMTMDGNRIGTNGVSPEFIATQVPNRFAGRMGQPPTLRVVPLEMTMQMHMLGAMWAPSDRVTLMAMLPYVRKHMDHVTFQGGMGTTRLGVFTTVADGLGDAKLSALFPVWKTASQRLHLTAGLSLPTGSTDETDDVLAPNGMRPTLRLPYPMQLGTGTWDLLPAATYAGHDGHWSWGAQASAAIRLGDNDDGYAHGDTFMLTGWGSYLIAPQVSVSLRLAYEDEGRVEGIDPQIVAPVQTANPDFQGGTRLAALAGLNWHFVPSTHRLAIELGETVYQDLNGPQLERDLMLRVGYQQTWK